MFKFKLVAFATLIGSTEVDLEEEGIDECERAVVDRALPKNIINDTEHNTDFPIPATPLQFGRYNSSTINCYYFLTLVQRHFRPKTRPSNFSPSISPYRHWFPSYLSFWKSGK